MPVVIDQLEIVKDERAPATPQPAGERAPEAPGQRGLSARDVEDLLRHSERRALRIRPC